MTFSQPIHRVAGIVIREVYQFRLRMITVSVVWSTCMAIRDLSRIISGHKPVLLLSNSGLIPCRSRSQTRFGTSQSGLNPSHCGSQFRFVASQLGLIPYHRGSQTRFGTNPLGLISQAVRVKRGDTRVSENQIELFFLVLRTGCVCSCLKIFYFF